MQLTLTRHAREHTSPERGGRVREILRKGEHEIKREEPFPRSRAHIWPGTGSLLANLFVFFFYLFIFR